MEETIICLVCKTPSSVFHKENGKTYRLSKTIRRITAKKNKLKEYVHETPCLQELVNNWANYIVNDSDVLNGKSNENK